LPHMARRMPRVYTKHEGGKDLTANDHSFNMAVLSLHMVNDVVTKEGKFGPFFAEQVEVRNVIEKGK